MPFALGRHLCILLSVLLACASTAFAEVSELKVAKQYGISYLPLMLMEDGKLIEKHAKAAGVDVTVTWATFAGGNVMNDALLSNSLQFASGGVGPFVTLWSRTRGNLDVRGVSAINSMPLYLNTRNPAVKSIKDFTDKDRIALPAVKVSIQAITLQMAAEKAFGEGQQERLDPLTVTMSHPDAQAGAAVGPVGDRRALRLSAVPVPAAAQPGDPHGAQLLRRTGRAGHVQRRVDDVEIPQRKPQALRRLRESAGRGDSDDQQRPPASGGGVPAHFKRQGLGAGHRGDAQ